MSLMREKSDEAPPDWSDSKTEVGAIWKNRLMKNADNLLIADGTIATLRERLAKAEEDSKMLDFLASLGRLELRKLPGSMHVTPDGARMYAPFFLAGNGIMFSGYEDLRETISKAMETVKNLDGVE